MTSGAPTPAELRAFAAGLVAHPDYRPGLGFLIDRRAAPPFTGDYIQLAMHLARQLGTQIAGARVAVIVADTASFGQARHLQTLAALLPLTMEIFWQPTEAETWLRGTRPPADPTGGSEAP